MTDRARQLGALHRLAALKLDVTLAELQRAARDREASLALLAGLETAAETDLPPVAAEQARLLHQRWAATRRTEINLVLARQTAEWMDRQSDARKAFGQVDALRHLQQKASRR